MVAVDSSASFIQGAQPVAVAAKQLLVYSMVCCESVLDISCWAVPVAPFRMLEAMTVRLLRSMGWNVAACCYGSLLSLLGPVSQKVTLNLLLLNTTGGSHFKRIKFPSATTDTSPPPCCQ